MRCPTRRGVALIICACMLSSASTAAAELQEQTSRAYESYRASAEKRFFARLHTPAAASDIIGRPGDKDGIIPVDGGLIHHWVGTCFIPGLNLQKAIEISQRYDGYPSIY